MRRVINGLRYNTETSTAVASWEPNGLSSTDFHYYEEELYVTRSGRWFLVGEGGPLSPYSEPCGSNGSTGGSALRPLSEAEARHWLEQHGETSAIEQYFSSEIQDA